MSGIVNVAEVICLEVGLSVACRIAIECIGVRIACGRYITLEIVAAVGHERFDVFFF